MGQAVGAGSLTTVDEGRFALGDGLGEDIRLRSPLTTDDVDNSEDDDPDNVDKVPVHGENIDVAGMLVVDLAEQS